MCAFMYDIYGIVKVDKYSYNKGEYFLYLLITLSFLHKREPKDECCVLWCTQYR